MLAGIIGGLIAGGLFALLFFWVSSKGKTWWQTQSTTAIETKKEESEKVIGELSFLLLFLLVWTLPKKIALMFSLLLILWILSNKRILLRTVETAVKMIATVVIFGVSVVVLLIVLWVFQPLFK